MKKILFGILAISLLISCSGKAEKNESEASLDSTVSSPIYHIENLSEDEVSKTSNDNQDDPMQLHLADFLVPMKEYPQYEISQNIPEILEKKGFRKGKRSSGKPINILGEKGTQYVTPFTRNYDGSEMSVILMEQFYEYEGEKLSSPGIEFRFPSEKEKNAFLSEAAGLTHLKKGDSTGDEAVYSDIGDLRIYVDGNTVTIKYFDYPM